MTQTDAGPRPGTTEPQGLSLRSLRKVYATRGREPFEAVKGLDMEVHPGELVALLGPSGCGKTTTLRMVAGLETVTSGEIWIGDRSVGDLPPGKRDVGVGFESYALYPPLDVRENLAYGLKARRAKDAAARVEAIAERLEMTDLLDLRPAGLSSGQKQRVALARALVRNPPVLLLDEPLSHLDAAQRQRVRRELKVLQRESGYTTVVVTHDQLEALSLADRMAVMDGGVIQQLGTPDEVFDDPANLFVADFVGEPKINLVEGVVVRGGPGARVVLGEAGTARGEGLATAATGVAEGDRVTVGLRPQDARISRVEDGRRAAPDDGVPASVRVFEHLLEFGLATLDVPGVDTGVVVQTDPDQRYAPGERVVLQAPAARVHLFDPDGGRRLR
ncbi:ABC transporter ATP-binding protein [uncultured Pseudokineococcus sp.]|uniref:ABC transporter ATP-binding protein n=1 Tax=uncultured Pseudokineococcus sp. TaxID=1642928 RepID=UPI0026220640|nr:ABC transporter ATP-binding protein [uncultured Pseudokineococcus sp.]